MAGITAAPIVRCITTSPTTAERVVAAVVATVSGSATDAASPASAKLVHRVRAYGVRCSSTASSSQPNSKAARLAPMTWPTATI
jgi:hypothetical protein